MRKKNITVKGGHGYQMGIPIPEGEMLRRAIRWISPQREAPPRLSLIELVEEAGKPFDLSPKDCDFLFHFFSELPLRFMTLIIVSRLSYAFGGLNATLGVQDNTGWFPECFVQGPARPWAVKKNHETRER